MRTDVALEILSDPQSYPFDTVRSAGQHAAGLIAKLEAENARLRSEVERLEDRLNNPAPKVTEAWQIKDCADGWIDFATAEEALAEVRVMGSALIRPAPTAAQEAALEKQLAKRVRVKPLEWVNVDAYCSWCYAKTVVGEYRITWNFSERGHRLTLPDGDTVQCVGQNSRAEAKAAAQADFERRILSALEADPAPVVAEEKCDGQVCYYHGCQYLPGCAL